MNTKAAGIEIAQIINSLNDEDKRKVLKYMSIYLNTDSKIKLEDALGVVI